MTRSKGRKKQTNRNKIYVGITDHGAIVFRSRTEPKSETHGGIYTHVIGPFRTLRGANYMKQFGLNNPHCVTVCDAERLAEMSRT